MSNYIFLTVNFSKKVPIKRPSKRQIEKREYWQTDDISWLRQKKEWAGRKTIILTRNTIMGQKEKNEQKTVIL